MTGAGDGRARVGLAATVWCPFPDQKAVRRAAKLLLNENLIACANILPSVESIFEYDGQVSASIEAVGVFKTTSEKLESVISRLGELHPYDTPAIVGWECDAAHPSTLNWLNGTIGTA